jgi:predicted nucleic acid-binding protein
VILVDTNVPMYLVGDDERHKARTEHLLDRAVTSRERLVTDAEVFQRFCIGTRPSIDSKRFNLPSIFCTELSTKSFPSIFPPSSPQNLWCLAIATCRRAARDALHVAVMQEHGVDRIMSFDRGFDAIPGLRRLGE